MTPLSSNCNRTYLAIIFMVSAMTWGQRPANSPYHYHRRVCLLEYLLNRFKHRPRLRNIIQDPHCSSHDEHCQSIARMPQIAQKNNLPSISLCPLAHITLITIATDQNKQHTEMALVSNPNFVQLQQEQESYFTYMHCIGQEQTNLRTFSSTIKFRPSFVLATTSVA